MKATVLFSNSMHKKLLFFSALSRSHEKRSVEGGSDWRDQIEEQSKLDEEKTRRMEEGATCQNRFQQTRVQVYARYALTLLKKMQAAGSAYIVRLDFEKGSVYRLQRLVFNFV
jgi:hypothetical protein